MNVFCKKNIFLLLTVVTMSAVRVSVAAAHGLSVNVLWAGHLTLPL